MANRKNSTPEPKRGVGRPSSFPGVECKAFLATIPIETREMIRTLAKRRGENINLTVDRMIRRAFKDATRSRSKKS